MEEKRNGEQIEKIDVRTETRSGVRLEGQLYQVGGDKMGFGPCQHLFFLKSHCDYKGFHLTQDIVRHNILY